MNSTVRKTQLWLGLLVWAMSITFAMSMSAQVNTETTTTSGQATHEITVERGEVVLVRGNDLFVKMDDGSMRHFPNVPESARATVGDRQLGIRRESLSGSAEKRRSLLQRPELAGRGREFNFHPPKVSDKSPRYANPRAK